MTLRNPEAWEGDGFYELDDDEIVNLFRDLGCLAFEVKALADACKMEAWVREKTAKHEDREDNLVIARFWWRRTERLLAVVKTLDKITDESGEEK